MDMKENSEEDGQARILLTQELLADFVVGQIRASRVFGKRMEDPSIIAIGWEKQKQKNKNTVRVVTTVVE